MNITQYIPLQLLISLILGIGFATIFPSGLHTNTYFFVIITVLLCLALYLHFKTTTDTLVFALFSAIIFMSVGYLRTNLSNPQLEPTHYSHFEKTINELIFTLIETKKESAISANFIAKITQINGIKSTGKINLTLKKDSSTITPFIGAQYKLVTGLSRIKQPLNPYEFNYQAYLKNNGIYHQLYTPIDALIALGNGPKINHWTANFRKKITERLAANGFNDESLAMINALILGQRKELSNELIENYQNAGAIHILAVSGLHVGIILLLFNFLLHPLLSFTFGKPLKLVLIILGLWGYSFLAGSSPSVIRAATMFTAVAIGIHYQNRINTIQALLLSLFILLVIRPNYLFEVGFQLSYIAVFFIVWLQPLIEKLWRPKQCVLRYCWQLLSVSGAAQLGVLPLSLYYFHQFPGLFFLSNLLIIPLLGSLIIAGILIIVLALINSLPSFLVVAYSFIITTLNALIAWIAQQDFFIIEHISFSLGAVLLGYISLVALLNWAVQRRFIGLLVGLISLCCYQLSSLQSSYVENKQRFIIFNTYRETLVAVHTKAQVHGFTSDTSSVRIKNLLTNYAVGAYANDHEVRTLKNTYQFGKNVLTIIDKKAILPLSFAPNAIVLLSHSPAINIDRLVQQSQPIQIVADASNYPADIIFWEKTCKSHNIKFHYTVRDGAFLQQF